ncbi:MAG: acetyl-CoA carboxylase biotin carboxyl carrier protein [Candidatus Omnitrophica bacterium]|nr:acetyl-CoA carboxylase biotin carboxyl carrier protein [Candidatus Omnitrophota bacterium]
MKPEELKEYIEFMKKEGLVYLEVRKKDFNLVLKKDNDRFEETPTLIKEDIPHLSQEQIIEESRKKIQHIANTIYVKSPLVGMFYLAPSPHAKTFVEIGSHVQKGDTLCIIEAMKVMNEINADENGIVKEILVETGKPVEFGQLLFILEGEQ